MEGVLVSAKRAGSTHHRHRRQRRDRPLQLPAQSSGAWHVLDSHSRRGYELDGRRHGHRRRPADRAARSEAPEDTGPRLAALERRMVHELAGHRRREERPAELHAVPRAPADRPFALHREPSSRPSSSAWDGTRREARWRARSCGPNEHGGGFANPIRDAHERRRPRRRTAGTAGSSLRDGRIPRVREPQLRPLVDIR